MKHIKLIKKICEVFLFFFNGKFNKSSVFKTVKLYRQYISYHLRHNIYGLCINHKKYGRKQLNHRNVDLDRSDWNGL